MRVFIISALCLLGCVQLFGQQNRKEVFVEFPVGISILDTSYGNNAANLSDVVSYLETVKNDPTLELTEVSFCGSASPEGKFAFNKRLANNRRKALEAYVCSRVSIPDSVISRCSQVFAWNALRELVEKSDMPNKKEVIDILLHAPEFTYNNKGIWIDSRKKQLMDLQHGRSWHYMHKHFFARIRNANVILITVRKKNVAAEELAALPLASLLPESSGPSLPAQTLPAKVASASAAKSNKPFYMAVKINMLYDALTVPNLGVEFYLGKNWSAGGNWAYCGGERKATSGVGVFTEAT